MLDVKNPNKGVLLPRVSLTGTNDVSTIPSPAIGLFIYNINTSAPGANSVTPGFYFWNGGAWIQFSTNASLQVVPELVHMAGSYGAGSTYNLNDLVSSATPGVYFYSIQASNLGNTPETSPAFWQPTTIDQLHLIHKQLTLSAPGFTSLMSIHLTGTNTAGGRIQYNVTATDGGSQIAVEEGVIQYDATANSITSTVQTTDKLHLGTVNSGCTPGFFNPLSQPGVSIFDNVTFSSPAPIVTHDVYFRIPSRGAI